MYKSDGEALDSGLVDGRYGWYEGETALFFMIANQNMPMVKWLLDNGARCPCLRVWK